MVDLGKRRLWVDFYVTNFVLFYSTSKLTNPRTHKLKYKLFVLFFVNFKGE